MDHATIRALLDGVRRGEIAVDDAAMRLETTRTPAETPAPSDEAALGWATLDLQRLARTGMPEVIFGAGKDGEQIATLLAALSDAGQFALATRVSAEKAAVVVSRIPSAVFHARAGVVSVGTAPERVGRVGVVSAGVSDGAVSEEAAVVAEALGNEVDRVSDVGIAGVHRLLRRVDRLQACRALVVVAGMDGALPGLVAGLVSVPIVAVPTSVGYGASFGGLAALLTMLNACAPGVTVVNIDNGFGAAVAASRINRGRI